MKGRNSLYIINNSPDDTLALKREVEKFIYTKFSADSIRKEDRTFHFYKADKYLTCDFREGEPYEIVPWHMTLDTIQDLRNHIRNSIIDYGIYYRENKTGFYYYNFDYNTKGEELYIEHIFRDFNDIDSLFRAKQKEYGIK
ncbi:hypothetical protein CKY20_11195 [Capnocytophaga canis]|uniref:Uncharacterized protein n=2 Tax=Capnocytophaga canis TaxID=1848903 RepID=A0A3A1YDD2_9FLAO|nr:hypothetical protein CKY20_11195 [Capnocytophaga canis]